MSDAVMQMNRQLMAWELAVESCRPIRRRDGSWCVFLSIPIRDDGEVREVDFEKLTEEAGRRTRKRFAEMIAKEELES